MDRYDWQTVRAGAAVLLVGGSLVLAGCGGGKKEGAGGPPGGGAPPPAQVTVVTVTPKTIAVPYEFTGNAEGSREVEVRARVSGILLQRTYEEGKPVRKGQTLFVIDPAPYRAAVAEASAQLAEEKAQVVRFERDVARLEPLLKARAASRKDYDNAVADVAQAKAAAQSAQAALDRAKLDLSYTRVEAPITGLSSRAEHSEGSLVAPGESGLLTKLVRIQPIWVRFSVPDRELAALRAGIADRSLSAPAPERLEVEVVLGDGTVHPERGRVNFSDSQIDTQTGSVDLRAELPNAAGTLIPGQFLRVRLVGVERPDSLVVPQRAVQTGQQGKFVFVVGADGKAQVKPVVVSSWLGSDWVVDSGLAAGDKVVVDGAVKVQPGAPVQVVDPNAPPPSPSAGAGAKGAKG